MDQPLTLIANEELRAWRQERKDNGQRIGLVPTMGALHEGHISLVSQIRSQCDQVIVSIFVNPLQFGPSEDFERYPRTFKADLEILKKNGVETVFVPNISTMYQDGFQTYITNRKMASVLCGASRPGHFDGVLTVVLKLFNIVEPHVVAFGKKDYQQLSLISQMVTDLNINISIMGCETLRESDGLAMSSRNRYLNVEDRRAAVRLSQGLMAAKAAFQKGERKKSHLYQIIFSAVNVQGIELDYLEIRKQKTLEDTSDLVAGPAVALIAAKVGQTRLIDNVELI